MTLRLGLVVGSAALALGLASEAAAYSWDEPGLWVPDLAVGLCFIATGALARQRGAGALLAATGGTWFVGNFSAELLYLHRGPLIHLLVAYAGARPRSRLDLVAVGVGYAAAMIAPAWSNDPAMVILVTALVAVLIRGFLVAAGPVRRERLTALGAGAAIAAVLVATATADAALLAYEGVLACAALWLYARLPRIAPAAVADLVVELGEARSGLLRDRLARLLGDPTLSVGYWSSQAGGFVDDAGHPLALPQPEAGRVATRVEREGLPFAVLVHDAAVLADPALVEAVAYAARLTASNATLQAERRSRAGELVASRRRLLLAADREREALGLRLRRGPEQRLNGLNETLAVLPGTQHLATARTQLARTLDDLHELERGLHPRELVEGGLHAALGSLAEHAPVDVELDLRVQRLPEELEATLYFVCAEALANVAKYAAASRVRVIVTADDGQVSLVVADDGAGGADPSRGTGLRGLADRVEALGGSLEVASPLGDGTRLVAEIPH
jgi:signal transduction histidine kinase